MATITAADVVAWLAETVGLRPGGPIDVEQVDVGRPGRPLPKMPNRLAAVYAVPGTGESHEGVFDGATYQVRLRWEPGDPIGAERAARELDHRIRQAGAESQPIGDDAWLLSVSRTGGGMSPLENGDGDGDRATFTGTYLFPVAEYPHQ